MRIGLAIVRLASVLVPRCGRDEWLAEWKAELCHVSRVGGRDIAFSLGAFADAFWLRRNSVREERLNLASPLRCLGWLGFFAAATWLLAALLPQTRNLVAPSPYRDAAHLAMLSLDADVPGSPPRAVTLGEFRRWNGRKQTPFAGLAFYEIGRRSVRSGDGKVQNLRVARTSANLFELLQVAPTGRAVNVGALPLLILREGSDVRGEIVDVAGERARVAGVLPDRAWRLPGSVDAWLIENEFAFQKIPRATKGFVLARLREGLSRPTFGGRWYLPVPGADWGFYGFECEALSPSLVRSIPMFLLMLGMGCMLARLPASLSLGEYPSPRQYRARGSYSRRWIFLVAKIALVLATLYCGTLDLMALAAVLHSVAPIFTAAPIFAIYAAYPLAVAWVAKDQRQRCPVCLRLLTNPVRVGEAGSMLLGYSATELICAQGHGLLHIPEFPTSYFATQRWVYLDRSWTSVFAGRL